jgi:hypothetical protein
MCPASGQARRRPMALVPAPTIALSAAVAVLLIALAGAYGYHRDELYFLIAGRHLAWAYPDQGPVTPLIAHVMDLLAPGSLTVLRVPSALMSGADVLISALIARELGGNRRAQVIAAACTAVASVTLFVGHLLSTTTLDLLAWATVTWLVARIQRTRERHLWLLVGLIAGIALLNKPLIAFLLAGLGVGLLVAGPRELLRSPWPWGGLLLAMAIWSPWLLWQGDHHWPQLKVSSAIAAGGSGSSQPRWALIPFQFLLVSPVLAPIWVAGLVALFARERLKRHRSFAVAWVFLALVFLATGGKPYYLAGMFPVLLAAGAIETDAWLARGARRRGALLWSMVALSGLVSVLLALPVLPARDAALANSTNSDVGETIGWPELVREVAVVYRRAPRAAVIFTGNYGEAGAVDRYGPALGLPAAYSGHNGFGYWGPPKLPPGPVVAVGANVRELREFEGCRVAARIENTARIDNDERREPVYLCTRPAAPWAVVWPRLRHLG